jgi:hypothetical protein
MPVDLEAFGASGLIGSGVHRNRDLTVVRSGWQGGAVAIRLNRRALQHARYLIGRGRVVLDERGAWSRHRPSTRQRDAYIRRHGIRGYSSWFLGIDDQAAEGTKPRSQIPYGDFENVHRCAVLSAEERASRYRYPAIGTAAANLHEMLDQLTQEVEA